MKAYYKLMVAVVMVGVLLVGYALLATGQKETESPEAIEQETYVSEVIIQAPWGEKNLWYDKEESKPGEFGIHFTGEGPPVTPSGFTTAPNGDIYINGEKLVEPYRTIPQRGPVAGLEGQKGIQSLDIPEGDVYLLGDNRPHSYDSRHFGPVSVDLIRGKVLDVK